MLQDNDTSDKLSFMNSYIIPNALLNAPSCINDESSTYLDVIIQYLNIHFAAFDPQLSPHNVLLTIFTSSDIADNPL